LGKIGYVYGYGEQDRTKQFANELACHPRHAALIFEAAKRIGVIYDC
jgi:hypothetical protein